ncbi:protein artichoke-like [Anopheles marshallii]|uniref:protein artichoke-like n=1 Tax=Anopheles marshallii TaxID=1521116 RepID=UPI00237A50A5|nr:protein artichoke-like [Anopheles marshallii]
MSSRAKILRLTLTETNLTDIRFECRSNKLEFFTIIDSRISVLPVGIKWLSNIKAIDILKSSLKFVDFSLFSKLARLEHISLSYNEIASLQFPDGQREDFGKLKDIFLSNNFLTTVRVNDFNNMRALEMLDLSNNRIVSFDGHLESNSLRNLDLSHNRFAALSFCGWNVTGLTKFDAHNNTLKRLPVCMETAMPSVSYLMLSSNVLAGDEIWHRLATMTNLQMLDVNHNRLTSAVAVQWKCVDFGCSVWNWNPFQEGSFSLTHRPAYTASMTFLNLKTFSLSLALLEQKNLLEEYTTIKRSPVYSIYLPSRTNLSALVLEETYVSNVTFEANNTYLDKLSINDSRLKDVPITVIHLSGIECIQITNSRIRSVDISLFAKLHRLESLNLNFNLIKHLDCSTTADGDFPNLKELFLSYNRLTTVNFKHFSTMHSLKVLYLSNNQIIQVQGSLVTGNLTFLDLSQNSISTLSCCNWTVDNLNSFDMYNNKLELLPTCIEDTMSSLNYLHLSANALYDSSIWNRLASMRDLQVLEISYNQLTSVVLSHALPSLTYLNVEHNRITAVSVSVANDGLSINANCNRIEQFDPANVTHNVTTFHMHCNPLDCSWDRRFNTGQSGDEIKPQCVVDNDIKCEGCHA